MAIWSDLIVGLIAIRVSEALLQKSRFCSGHAIKLCMKMYSIREEKGERRAEMGEGRKDRGELHK